MAKNRKAKGGDSSRKKAAANPDRNEQQVSDVQTTISLREWLSQDRRGLVWVVGCILMGAFLGFTIGAGWLEFSSSADGVKPWRQDLGDRLRSTTTYKVMTFQASVFEDLQTGIYNWAARLERDYEVELYASNPSHPRVFAVLREAVVREKNGYVHPDLGFLVPAPCGASRGIGMVRDSYNECQIHCVPGMADEKLQVKKEREEFRLKNEEYPLREMQHFRQEEVLVRVPLGFQMTREAALKTLLPIIPADVQQRSGLLELDDAILITLLLAHERGVGRYSRWSAYIASLPPEPSCGYSYALRPYMMDSINALRNELGVETQGWPEELVRASQYAKRITENLAKNFNQYIKTPSGDTAAQNLKWALCQVASRAIAGTPKFGAVRLVPMMDQINHDANAGRFIELTGKEKLDQGDFVDATEDDAGTFVVRSLRHGQRKALRKGQELLANYNVPHYSPLDWIVSMSFLPPEMQTPWQRIEPVLPRMRSSSAFSTDSPDI